MALLETWNLPCAGFFAVSNTRRNQVDLPPHLRTCLMYLSTFPEDYEIQKDDLIWKWIAEGFINEKQGTRLFELGERYFNDLTNRSLIQAVENDRDGIVSGCRVHDMVLDLMRKLSSEENFLAILGDNVEGTSALSNVRRLAIQNRIAEHINAESIVTARMTKVRSYTAFFCSIDSRDLFLRLGLLRVLDIVKCNFKDGCHLEHLGDLYHLRYLAIKSNGIDGPLDLPKQIGNLKLLQTLDVDGKLPATIVQLTKLVRLCSDKEVPDGVGKLILLEELLISDGCSDKPKQFFKEIGNLRELRSLSLDTKWMDESMQRDFVESLSNLQKIQYIFFTSCYVRADTAMWEAAGFVLPRPLYCFHCTIIFSNIPSCINPSHLPNLSGLTLWVTTLDEQDLKLLASLPALCYLDLTTKSTVTASNINTGDGCFFQKLRHFSTDAMVQFEQPNEEDTSVSLHIWNRKDAMPFAPRKSNDYRKVVTSGVMPNLEMLSFTVPLRALKDNNSDNGNIGLEYLHCIQELELWIMCEDVSVAERDAALAALRNACKLHPNNPTLGIYKFNEGKMVSTYDNEDERQRQEEEVATQTAHIDLGKLCQSSS